MKEAGIAQMLGDSLPSVAGSFSTPRSASYPATAMAVASSTSSVAKPAQSLIIFIVRTLFVLFSFAKRTEQNKSKQQRKHRSPSAAESDPRKA
jgi:hypothetical protein